MSAPQRTVLITGATRGLGLAICERLALAGYQVVGAARKNSPEFEDVARQHSGRVSFQALDLAQTAGHHEWMRRLEQQFGPLYGLVNNGAVAHDGVLATMHESQILELIQVNLAGTIILTKYALRSMLPLQRGRVIQISSIIATTGFNGLSVYAATKAALIGFTRSLAREVGRANITANAILPGYMETRMSAGLSAEQLDTIRRRSPLRQLAQVGDVAAAVEYLLSPAGDRVTGAELRVDAGSTA
jgi:3-oxoacyl-[acyl-carrier protein] reductase